MRILVWMACGALACAPATAKDTSRGDGPARVAPAYCTEPALTTLLETRWVPAGSAESWRTSYVPNRTGPIVVSVLRQGVNAEYRTATGELALEFLSPAPLDARDTFLIDARATEPIELLIEATEVNGPAPAVVVRFEAAEQQDTPFARMHALLRRLTASYALYLTQVDVERQAARAILQAMGPQNELEQPASPPATANWQAVDDSLSKLPPMPEACTVQPGGKLQHLHAEFTLARAALATLKLESWSAARQLSEQAEAQSSALGLTETAVRARLLQASALIDGAAEAKRSNEPDRQHEAAQSFQRAQALLTAARDHYRQDGRVADEAYVENYLGAADHYAGSWDGARQHYESANRLYAGTSTTYRHAVVAQNLAVLSRDRGDYPAAASFLERAKSLIRGHPQPDMLATIMETHGTTLSVLGRQDEAIAEFSAAMSIRRAQADDAGIARCLLGNGIALMRAGDWQAAAPNLDRAWSMGPTLQQRDRRGWLAIGLAQSELQRMRGEHAQAARTLDAIQPAAVSPSQQARLAIQRAETLLASGNASAALAQFDAVRAIRQLPPMSPSMTSAGIGRLRALIEMGELESARAELEKNRRAAALYPGSLHEIESRFLLADIEARLGATDRALKAVDQAIAATRAIRSASLSAQSRARFAASRREQDELKICLLARCSFLRRTGEAPASRADAVESLFASEEARTGALEELVASAADRRHGSVHAAAERGALLGDIESKLTRLDTLSDRPVANAREIASMQQSVRDLQMRLRRLTPPSPPRHAMAAQRSSRKHVADVLARIPPRTTILEFFLGHKSALLWVIKRDNISVHEIASGSAEVAALRTAALSLLDASASDAMLPQRLAKLGDVLLGAHVDLRATDRLVIVPDAELFYVPFAALAAPGAPDAPRRHVLEGIESLLVPSLSQLAFDARGIRLDASTATVAILADPVFDEIDPRVPGNLSRRNALADPSPKLPRLPATVEEVIALQALLPKERVTVLTGTAATRERLLKALGTEVTIAHFATHGVVRPADPNLSFLALSAFDAQWRATPARLYGAEILSAGLRADLVVLSACRSAVGEVVRGEGPLGLSYSFLANGSRAVIAANWPVPDRFAAEFMRYFYGALAREGATVTGALRAAQLQARDSALWGSPYYWGAFSLTTTAL